MDDAAAVSDKKTRKHRLRTKMDFVPKANGFGNPYVAFFPSRFDPLEKADDADDGKRAEFASYRNPKPLSRQQELVVHGQDGVDFVGCNYLGDAAGWQPCDYLLGVFDKEKGSLKVMPLAGEKVFRMEPRVRGLAYGNDAIDEEAVEEEGGSAEQTRAKRKILTEAFGNSKSIKRAAQFERAKVKESDLGDFKGLESLFQEAARNEELLTTEQALQMANSVVVRSIPPHDLTASTPHAAYPVDKIITPDEWDALSVDVKELESAALMAGSDQSSTQNNYPTFVLNRLKRLRTKGDMEGNKKRAHILLYMKHLLVFHFASDTIIKKAADWSVSTADTVNLTERLHIPGPIVSRFLEIFTTKGVGSARASRGCHRNKEHKELIISYILVLGLIVDDFYADPFDLATELKMTISQLQPHYEQVGCKISHRKVAEKYEAGEDKYSAKLKWKVTLPVPLKFPMIINPLRRKAKR